MRVRILNRYRQPVHHSPTVDTPPVVGDRLQMPGPAHDPRPFVWIVIEILPTDNARPHEVTVVCAESSQTPTYQVPLPQNGGRTEG